MVYIFNSELNQLLCFCIIVFYSRVNYNDIFLKFQKTPISFFFFIIAVIYPLLYLKKCKYTVFKT